MLRLQKMNAPIQTLLSTLLVTIFLFSIGVAFYKGDKVISHNEEWITPFKSITTTVYDLGDGYTSTVTTTTDMTIASVKHTDQGMFSTEQWHEILCGIENGSIVWED